MIGNDKDGDGDDDGDDKFSSNTLPTVRSIHKRHYGKRIGDGRDNVIYLNVNDICQIPQAQCSTMFNKVFYREQGRK